MSPSAMRTSRPNLCTGRAPDSIKRRTVRGDTFKRSAVSSMVRNLVRGRARVLRQLVPGADLEADRFGGVVRELISLPCPRRLLQPFLGRAAIRDVPDR
jgi:hypothetical protein